MTASHFFDQTLELIERGDVAPAMYLLAGHLHAARSDANGWRSVRDTFRAHPLRDVLLEDPSLAHCVARPRGYPGDAALIDFLYDRRLQPTASERGAAIFGVATSFQAPEAVRQRLSHARHVLTAAWQAGKRVCVLACGHLREADLLVGNDMSTVVAVDQDKLSLDVVRRNHPSIEAIETNAFRYLRTAVTRGAQFDLIYSLGLTDYLDDRAMDLLHRLGRACLAPEGSFLLANFVPQHLGIGWMDAVMDWHLIYRDQEALAQFAERAGMTARTWLDGTGSIAWCEMHAD